MTLPMQVLVKALSGKATGPAASARMFILFLAVTFAVEAVVMIMLPQLLPPHASVLFEAICDAALLTSVLTPIVWLVFIRPLEKLHLARGELVERLLHVQEDERGRIARDLHDGLGQNLTSMMLRLRAMEEMSSEAPVKEQAVVVRGIASDALAWVRRVVREARPPVLDELGLAAALEKQFADVTAASGIPIHLNWQPDRSIRWPRDVETALYRGVQESVTNAVRHSECGHIEVIVEAEAGGLVVRVQDDGIGFDTFEVFHSESRPFGLLSLQERMAAVGGSVSFESRSGCGTIVTIKVTVPSNEGAS